LSKFRVKIVGGGVGKWPVVPETVGGSVPAT